MSWLDFGSGIRFVSCWYFSRVILDFLVGFDDTGNFVKSAVRVLDSWHDPT